MNQIGDPVGWEKVFKKSGPDLEDIEQRLTECKHYFPRREKVFIIFFYLAPWEIRVVILGQDPYPGTDEEGEPIANGIPFAIDRGIRVTSSLHNIYQDMKQTVPGFEIPNHGNLTRWIRQGVFLLNSRLTVPEKRDEEPHNFWSGFLINVIEHIQEVNSKVIFVLWGNVAKDIARNYLRNTTTCFEACHPSGQNGRRFVGTGTLQAVNEELEKRGEPLIDWQLPPLPQQYR